jgi:hypothetical protein
MQEKFIIYPDSIFFDLDGVPRINSYLSLDPLPDLQFRKPFQLPKKPEINPELLKF